MSLQLLVPIVLVLLVIGVLLGGIKASPRIDPEIKSIITIVVICGVLLWLIGMVAGYSVWPLPRR